MSDKRIWSIFGYNDVGMDNIWFAYIFTPLLLCRSVTGMVIVLMTSILLNKESKGHEITKQLGRGLIAYANVYIIITAIRFIVPVLQPFSELFTMDVVVNTINIIYEVGTQLVKASEIIFILCNSFIAGRIVQNKLRLFGAIEKELTNLERLL